MKSCEKKFSSEKPFQNVVPIKFAGVASSYFWPVLCDAILQTLQNAIHTIGMQFLFIIPFYLSIYLNLNF